MRVILLCAALASGILDRGIFNDLDSRVSTSIPPNVVSPERARLRIDREHGILTLYDGVDPIKAYAIKVTTIGATWGASAVELSPRDRAELSPLVTDGTPVTGGAPAPDEDRDRDGIVDRLDILIGARKLLLNHARYIERYVSIPYPNGDVPRTEGVCSDTVVRALRNAGIDLQREIHDDILRARAAYPMVEKIDSSINHRRVHTLLPWFQRHWRTLPKSERYLPGDVVFFDTLPERDGPDHLGVVGDEPGSSGKLTVINNWTDGTVDAAMDLLAFVPVTHHFRAR
jgi:uncharacterized protein YijF (DUF1287 family)